MSFEPFVTLGPRKTWRFLYIGRTQSPIKHVYDSVPSCRKVLFWNFDLTWAWARQFELFSNKPLQFTPCRSKQKRYRSPIAQFSFCIPYNLMTILVGNKKILTWFGSCCFDLAYWPFILLRDSISSIRPQVLI